MGRTFLLVHPFSYARISGVVDYIFHQLTSFAPGAADFVICSNVDEAPLAAGSVIFIIGDPFGPFQRQSTCRYVFINFSQLYFFGDLSDYGPRARRWIIGKQKAFESKVGRYDFVLDAYPEQPTTIHRAFGVPARHFPIGLRSDIAPQEREFDVCFVGTMTPRRRTLAKRLTRLGVRLSPDSHVNLEATAARSKVMLNVHAFRSGNVEAPRIISGFLTGAALVTEPGSSLASRFPENLYVTADYADLSEATISLLDDPTRREALAKAASQWLATEYLPDCDKAWGQILASIYSSFGTGLRTEGQ